MLVVEAFGTARWLLPLLPSLAGYGAVALALIVLRLLVAALQLTGAGLLLQHRPPGPPLAVAALAASAILVVFEIGFRLTPTDSLAVYRWWMVGSYGVYAALAGTWLARRR